MKQRVEPQRNQRWRIRGICFAGLVMPALLSVGIHVAFAADEKAPATADSVARWVEQLDAEERTDREAAEQALLTLGPGVLEFLPAVNDEALSAEQRQRLRRLIPAIWRAKLDADLAGTKVSLGDKPVLLLDALKALSEKSGNRFKDLRPDFNQEVSNASFQIPADANTFWKALDAVVESAKVSLYYHADDRQIGIVGRPRSSGPVSYAGAFRFEAQRITLQRDLARPEELPECRILIDVLVEPRLRPLMFEIDTATFIVVDDKERRLSFAGPATYPIMIESSSFEYPFELQLAAPPRDSQRIAELSGEVLAWLPAIVETFSFDPLETGKPVEKESSGVRVRVDGVGDEDGVWTVPLHVEYALADSSAESFLQVMLQNELYLESADGTRFEQNGGMNTFPSQGNETRAEYLFVDAPGKLSDYKLVVKIPSGLTRVPVKFSFKNLALP